MMRIYVAGPYGAPTVEEKLTNTRAAIAAGLALLRLGHAPFIPHLTHWFDLETKALVKGGDFLWWDGEFLKVCDALLFLGSSPGADQEREMAERSGMPVYESIDAVPVAETREPMTPEQEAHLTRLQRSFLQRMERKYRAGQKEHGGDLFRKEGLLEEAVLEMVDQYTYIQTEIDRHHPGGANDISRSD